MNKEDWYRDSLAVWEEEWRAEEWKAEHLPALFEAVKFCRLQEIVLPEWAALAVLNLIIHEFNRRSGNKGRSRYAIDYGHFCRWRALSYEFRKAGIDKKKSGRPAKQAPGIVRARQNAADRLKGTHAQGSARQVQDSFDMVEAAQADGKAARFRFTEF